MTDKLTNRRSSSPRSTPTTTAGTLRRYATEDIAQETALDDDEDGGVLQLKLW